MLEAWKARKAQPDGRALEAWWKQIETWRAVQCLKFDQGFGPKDEIKPQYALTRLYELTKDMDARVTTEVGQNKMWAAQFSHFDKPNRSDERRGGEEGGRTDRARGAPERE